MDEVYEIWFREQGESDDIQFTNERDAWDFIDKLLDEGGEIVDTMLYEDDRFKGPFY